MPKLVQEGIDFVGRQELGEIFGSVREVHHKQDVGASLAPLLFEVVHPCTTSFAFAREEVEVQKSEQLLCFIVLHSVGKYIGLVDREFFGRDK